MEVVYFQPKGINPDYCEAGMIHESDPKHIWYLHEPCKVLISEVKIIPKENVIEHKNGIIKVKKMNKNNWILKKVILEITDGGVSYLRATYNNGYKELDEFFEYGYKIPTVIEIDKFGKHEVINDKINK